MDGILVAVRPLKGIGLLSCLVGTLCVIVSYFWPPFYSLPAWTGGGTQTGWEFSRETVKSMLAQHNTLGFILPISLTFLPVTAALLLGLLAIARVIALRPILATLFLVVYILGSIPLFVFLLALAYGGVLRAGYFGEVLGYILFLAGDLALRRAAAQAAPS